MVNVGVLVPVPVPVSSPHLGALVVQGLARVAHTLLARAQRPEVLHGLGHLHDTGNAHARCTPPRAEIRTAVKPRLSGMRPSSPFPLGLALSAARTHRLAVQAHDDAARGLTVNGNVEKHLVGDGGALVMQWRHSGRARGWGCSSVRRDSSNRRRHNKLCTTPCTPRQQAEPTAGSENPW